MLINGVEIDLATLENSLPDNKIKAIQEVMEKTGASLREAKEQVDIYIKEMPQIPLENTKGVERQEESADVPEECMETSRVLQSFMKRETISRIDVWKNAEKEMRQLENDRNTLLDYKVKSENLKRRDGKEYDQIRKVIFMSAVAAAVIGLIRGFIGVITNLIVWFMIWMAVEGYIDRKNNRSYVKLMPEIKNKLEEAEKENREKYKEKKYPEIKVLMEEELFSAEAVHYLSAIIMEQEEYDLRSAIESYRASEAYRPNLVKKYSQMNKEFLDFIL